MIAFEKLIRKYSPEELIDKSIQKALGDSLFKCLINEGCLLVQKSIIYSVWDNVRNVIDVDEVIDITDLVWKAEYSKVTKKQKQKILKEFIK